MYRADLVVILAMLGARAAVAQNDPLPSWNDRPAKQAIVDFVEKVTNEGGPDFVPPAERIATFDNDGTLWCEQPFQVQVFFLIDRVKELAAKDPGLKERQPFKALLEHDLKTLFALGKQGILDLFFATHAGMSEDEFSEIARTWLGSAKPRNVFLHTTGVHGVEVHLDRRALALDQDVVPVGRLRPLRAFEEESAAQRQALQQVRSLVEVVAAGTAHGAVDAEPPLERDGDVVAWGLLRRGCAGAERGEDHPPEVLHASSMRPMSRPSAYCTPTMRPFMRAMSR